MLKLVRNTFGEKQVLLDPNGCEIRWDFITKLEELQNSEGLHLGNKLRKAHIHFFKQKMKVRLAVQLLSTSVADALLYCAEELGLPEFKNCRTTANFIRLFNNLFDILNSRGIVPPGFKKALCQKNIDETTRYINEAIDYISGLKFPDGQLIIRSKRKTGFVGFIVSLKSELSLYNEIISEKQLLLFLPMYKCSQDHIELFFSSVRSRGGWNNNPSARQFTASYKRLLVRAEVREGGVGNCMPLEEISILTTSSSRLANPESSIYANHLDIDITSENDSLESIWKDHDYIMNTTVISEFSSQIIVYIAGFVTHQLQSSIKCVECVGALIGEQENFLHSLITRKSHGGLTYPSTDVCKICKIAEHFLRVSEISLSKFNFFNMLKSKIMFNVLQEDIFISLKQHGLELSNHIYLLIESVVTKYIKVRIHFITKRRSEIVDPVRSHLTKTILFKGQ